MPVIDVRICRKCGYTGPGRDFQQNSGRRTNVCLKCAVTVVKQWRADMDPEKRLQLRRVERQKYIAKDPKRYADMRWGQHIKNIYGISPVDVEQMLQAQNQVCAVCHQEFGGVRPRIDHDHKTDKVRGLVHQRCNWLIGMIETYGDAMAEGAVQYLKDRG